METPNDKIVGFCGFKSCDNHSNQLLWREFLGSDVNGLRSSMVLERFLESLKWFSSVRLSMSLICLIPREAVTCELRNPYIPRARDLKVQLPKASAPGAPKGLEELGGVVPA